VYNVTAVFNAIDNISGVAAGIGSNVAGLSSRVTEFGQNMVNSGMRLTAGLTVPLALAGAAVLKLGVDYEAAMTKVATMTGSTAAQTELYKAKVLELATIVPQTASQLAEGLYFVASAGFRGQEGMDVLTASAKAAANAMGSVDVVAQAVTSALAAYKLSGSDAGRVTDILTMGVIEGKVEFDELAGSIGRVLPIAAAAGVSLEEVTASLATMTRTGLSGEESATALRAALMSLFAPSAETVKALGEIGLTADQLRESIREKGLLATLQDLMDRTGGNVTMLDRLIPNVRGLVGVLATAGSQSGAYADILDKVKNSTGVTDEAFQKTQETARVQLALTRNSLEAVGLTVASQVLPKVVELAGGLRSWLDHLRQTDPATLRIVILLALLAAGIGPVLVILGALVTGFGALMGVLGFLLSPVGLVIAAVVALGVAWATNFGGIRDRVEPILVAIGARLRQAITWLQVEVPAALGVLRSWWDATWPRIQETITSVWARIMSYVGPIATLLSMYIQSSFQRLSDWWHSNWPAIRVVAETVWTAIQAIINFVVTQVVPFVLTQFKRISDWFNENWPLMLSVVNTIWSAIQSFIQTTVTNVVLAVYQGLLTIRAWWDEHGAAVTTIATSLWNGVKTLIETVITAVLGIIRAILLAINGNWEAAWTQVKLVAETIWTGLESVAKSLWTAVLTFLTEVWTSMQTVATTVWTAIQTFLSTTWTSIQTTASSIWSGIQATATSIWTGISGFFSTTLTGIQTTASTVWTGIQTTASTIWGGIQTFLSGVWTGLQTSASTIFTGLQTQVTTTFTAIQTSASTIWTAVTTAVSTAWTNIQTAVTTGLAAAAKAVREFDLASAGRALMDGLMRGVQEKVQGIIDAVTGGVQSAINAAKNLLGIPSSPSRVFTEIGQQTMAGLDVGMTESAPKAVSRVEEILKRVTMRAQEGQAAAAKVLGSIIEVFKSLVYVSETDVARESTLLVELAAVIHERLVDIQELFLEFVGWLNGPFRAMLLSIDLSGEGAAIGNSLANGLWSALPAVQAAAEALAAAARGALAVGPGMAPATAGAVAARPGAAGGATGAGGERGNRGTTEVHLHVGTLVADSASLRQLEATLRGYREQEQTRRGV
jgi:TP901 family phage tail tape measure protein